MSQYREFIGQVIRALPNEEELTGTMQGWINNPSALRKALREALLPSQRENTYTVTVDYGRTVEEMVEVGQYDWSNDNITSRNFPLPSEKGEENVEVEIIYFDRSISSEDAVAEMTKRGLRPATLAELLALGEQYPELQREAPIVALGSVWQDRGGDRGVPCLDGFGRERYLALDVWGGDWRGVWRFAAVRA